MGVRCAFRSASSPRREARAPTLVTPRSRSQLSSSLPVSPADIWQSSSRESSSRPSVESEAVDGMGASRGAGFGSAALSTFPRSVVVGSVGAGARAARGGRRAPPARAEPRTAGSCWLRRTPVRHERHVSFGIPLRSDAGRCVRDTQEDRPRDARVLDRGRAGVKSAARPPLCDHSSGSCSARSTCAPR